jgi:hypothetical protein
MAAYSACSSPHDSRLSQSRFETIGQMHARLQCSIVRVESTCTSPGRFTAPGPVT